MSTFLFLFALGALLFLGTCGLAVWIAVRAGLREVGMWKGQEK